MIWQILFLFYLLPLGSPSRVDTLLFAPWTSSTQSLLYEAGSILQCLFNCREFFSDVSDAAFLEFVKRVITEVKIDFPTEQKKKWVFEYCDSHFEKETCELLHLSLVTRYIAVSMIYL